MTHPNPKLEEIVEKSLKCRKCDHHPSICPLLLFSYAASEREAGWAEVFESIKNIQQKLRDIEINSIRHFSEDEARLQAEREKVLDEAIVVVENVQIEPWGAGLNARDVAKVEIDKILQALTSLKKK